MRRDVRYQVKCPVMFVVDGKPGEGTTFNLSRGGCAIATEMYTAVDDPVSLQITVSNQPTPITIELGKVRWSTSREFGVEFMVVENPSKRRLDDFLLVVAKDKLTS
ncbi:MAG TPA: PilZ domain-containing protein [Nitrospira sp.]|nr:PilZ domain-containing protein [Nitrospira sp.]